MTNHTRWHLNPNRPSPYLASDMLRELQSLIRAPFQSRSVQIALQQELPIALRFVVRRPPRPRAPFRRCANFSLALCPLSYRLDTFRLLLPQTSIRCRLNHSPDPAPNQARKCSPFRLPRGFRGRLKGSPQQAADKSPPQGQWEN